MNRSVTFYCSGTPAAQPRPRMTRTGRAYNPPSADKWKAAVRAAWAELKEEPLAGAVVMRLEFVIERPKSHLTTKGELTKSAPLQHTSKPDVDNLAKAVMDALENANAFPGDAAVTGLTITKRYGAAVEVSGCRVTITQRDP